VRSLIGASKRLGLLSEETALFLTKVAEGAINKLGASVSEELSEARQCDWPDGHGSCIARRGLRSLRNVDTVATVPKPMDRRGGDLGKRGANRGALLPLRKD
jgi:hypothetical protein